MTEETFTEDPLHFPKDISVYLVYDDEDLDQLANKIETKRSWEEFGYTVLDYPLLTIEQCEQTNLDLLFTDIQYEHGVRHEFRKEEQRIYYTYVTLWKKLRNQRRAGLIVPHNNILIKDFPRSCYDGFAIWLPNSEKEIFDSSAVEREPSFDQTVDGIATTEINASFDGVSKDVFLRFSGTMYVSYEGSKMLMDHVVKSHAEPFNVLTIITKSEKTGEYELDIVEYNETNLKKNVFDRAYIKKRFDEYGELRMDGQSRAIFEGDSKENIFVSGFPIGPYTMRPNSQDTAIRDDPHYVRLSKLFEAEALRTHLHEIEDFTIDRYFAALVNVNMMDDSGQPVQIPRTYSFRWTGVHCEDCIGTTHNFYNWLFHKCVSLPDHPLPNPRPWGNVFDITDETKYIISQD